MKTIDLHNYLHEQRSKYGKTVFTATELANVSSLDMPSLRTSLQRLSSRGIIQRYAQGRYGLAGEPGMEEFIASLDTCAYITGAYALHHHRLITQSSAEMTCFTNRRHNRSRARSTPFGKVVFVYVTEKIYSRPESGIMAEPEQALCDFVHICRQNGVVADEIVTFRNLESLSRERLDDWLLKYPATVRKSLPVMSKGGA